MISLNQLRKNSITIIIRNRWREHWISNIYQCSFFKGLVIYFTYGYHHSILNPHRNNELWDKQLRNKMATLFGKWRSKKNDQEVLISNDVLIEDWLHYKHSFLFLFLLIVKKTNFLLWIRFWSLVLNLNTKNS